MVNSGCQCPGRQPRAGPGHCRFSDSEPANEAGPGPGNFSLKFNLKLKASTWFQVQVASSVPVR